MSCEDTRPAHFAFELADCAPEAEGAADDPRAPEPAAPEPAGAARGPPEAPEPPRGSGGGRAPPEPPAEPLGDQETAALLAKWLKLEGMSEDKRARAEEKLRKKEDREQQKQAEQALQQAADDADAAEKHRLDMEKRAEEEAERERLEQRKLRVLRCAPQNLQASNTLSETVKVVFSHQPATVDESGRLSWEPAIAPAPVPAGRWTLSEDRTTLEYRKETPWTNATLYVVSASGVTSALGEPLSQDLSFSFQTPTASVTAVTPLPSEFNPTLPFAVTFGQPVNPEQALQCIALTYTDGSLPHSTEMNLVVGPGVLSLEGPSTPERDATMPVNTKNPILITFTQPITRIESVGRDLEKPPAIAPQAPEGRWVYSSEESIEFRPAVAWANATRYEVDVGLGFVSLYDETLAETDPRSFAFETARPCAAEFLTSRVSSLAPTSIIATTPVFLVFNQRVDPGRLIGVIPDGAPFPNESEIEISLEEGIESAEGSLASKEQQCFKFTTGSPLGVTSDDLSVSRGSLAPLRVSFNRELVSSDSLEGSSPAVTSTPPLPQLCFDKVRSLFGEKPSASKQEVHVRTTTLQVTGIFTVPCPGETYHLPTDPIGLSFNQNVNPAQILPFIRVAAKSGKSVPLKVFPYEDFAKLHPGAAGRQGQFVSFGPDASPFPFDADLSVQVGPKAPSAEGPVVSESSQASYPYRTVPRFSVLSSSPAKDTPLPKGSVTPLTVTFNRELYTGNASPPAGLLKIPSITPDPPKGSWSFVSSRQITYIPEQPWQNSTHYEVSLRREDGAIHSAFGEQLVPPDDPICFETQTVQVVSIEHVSAGEGLSWSPAHAPVFVRFDQNSKKDLLLKMIPHSAIGKLFETGILKEGNNTELFGVDHRLWMMIIPHSGHWPYDSHVTIAVGPNIPCAEGRLLGNGRWTHELTIGPPFKVTANFEFEELPLGSTSKPWLEFSHPIVKDKPELPWLPEIWPGHPGSWVVSNEGRRLEFTPAEPWRPSTEYKVAMHKGARSFFAEPLEEDAEVVFKTETNRLVVSYPLNEDREVPTNTLIVLRFTQDIDPQKIASLLAFQTYKLRIPLQYKCQLAVASTDRAIEWLGQQPRSIADRMNFMRFSETRKKWVAFEPSAAFPYYTDIALINKTPLKIYFTTCDKFVGNEKEIQPTENEPLGLYGTVKVPFNHPLSWEDTLPDAWKQAVAITPAMKDIELQTARTENRFVLHIKPQRGGWKNSTCYEVVIPANLLSAFQEPLSREVRFRFRTPSIRLIDHFPRDESYVDSMRPVVLVFDQALPENALSAVREAGQKKPKPGVVTLEPIQEGYVGDVPVAKSRVECRLAFRISPTQMPMTNVTVVLPEGFPSAEGPLVSETTYSFTFNILPSFVVERCWLHPALTELLVQFSQPVLRNRPFEARAPSFPPAGDTACEEDDEELADADERVFSRLSFSPQVPPGKWSVLKSDARVVCFRPQQPFRFSTRYTLDVGAGATSGMAHITIGKFQFQFCTPLVQIRSYYPTSMCPGSTPVAVFFNQPVDPVRLLGMTKVYVSGRKPYSAVEPLSPSVFAECALTDEQKKGLGRALLFRSAKPLPPNSAVQVVVGPAVPGEEGSETTESELSFEFHTAPQFVCCGVTTAGSGDAVTGFLLTFSHPISTAERKELPPWLPSVSPRIAGLQWSVQSETCLRGTAEPSEFRGSTRYVVSIPADAVSLWHCGFVADRQVAFDTPACHPLDYLPASPVPVTSPLLVLFSQQVDAAAVARCVQVSCRADSRVQLLSTKVAFGVVAGSAAVLEGCALALRYQASQWPLGRWVAIQPREALPAQSDVKVTIGPKIPSAEGPLLCAAKHKRRWSTLPLTQLAWRDYKPALPQGAVLELPFSDCVDPATLRGGAIYADPPLPLVVRHSRTGGSVRLCGLRPEGWCNWPTTHRLVVTRRVRDVHRQPLKSDYQCELTLLPSAFRASLRCPAAAQPRALVTHDPSLGPPALCVHSTNYTELRVVLYRLAASDGDVQAWVAGRGRLAELAASETREGAGGVEYFARGGRKALDQVVEVPEFRRDAELPVWVDLSPALQGGVGAVAAVVVPTRRAHFPNAWDQRVPLVAVAVQCTRLSAEVFSDSSGMTVWVSELASGAAVPGARVALRDSAGSAEATTDADGIATLGGESAGWGSAAPGDRVLLVARGADQLAVLDPGAFQRLPQPSEVRWHVFDDRGIYRPAESVRVKGYVRRLRPAGSAIAAEGGRRVSPLAHEMLAGHAVRYELEDARAVRVAEGSAETNAWGAFDLELRLPDGANLGRARLRLRLVAPGPHEPGSDDALSTHEHTFAVEEFRRPDFLVALKAATPAPLLYAVADADDRQGIVLQLDASYFAGTRPPTSSSCLCSGAFALSGFRGLCSDSAVEWTVASSRGSYTAAGLSEYSFDSESWRDAGWFACTRRLSCRTSDEGRSAVRVYFPPGSSAERPLVPVALEVVAAVTDLSNQTVSAATRLLLHPCEYCVGVEDAQPRHEVDAGAPEAPAHSVRIVVASAATGSPVAGAQLYLSLRSSASGAELLNADAVSEAPFLLRELRLPAGRSALGWYDLDVIAYDGAARSYLKQHRFELCERHEPVGPPPPPPPPAVVAAPLLRAATPPRAAAERELSATVALEGDVAVVTIDAGLAQPQAGLVCVVGRGILRAVPFRATPRDNVVRVALSPDWLPSVHLWVSVVGLDAVAGRPVEAAQAPSVASGAAECALPREWKRLAVAASSDDGGCVEPGAESLIAVDVRDHRGAAVRGAEVALVVVDESVLAVTRYLLPDPFNAFWAAGAAAGGSGGAALERRKVSSRCDIPALPWSERASSELFAPIAASSAHTASALERITGGGAAREQRPATTVAVDDTDDAWRTYGKPESRGPLSCTPKFTLHDSADPSGVDAESAGYIVMFSVTDVASVEAVPVIVKQLRDRSASAPLVIVGSKADQDAARAISNYEASTLAGVLNAVYAEVCCSERGHVESALRCLYREHAQRKPAPAGDLHVFVLGSPGVGKTTFAGCVGPVEAPVELAVDAVPAGVVARASPRRSSGAADKCVRLSMSARLERRACRDEEEEAAEDDECEALSGAGAPAMAECCKREAAPELSGARKSPRKKSSSASAKRKEGTGSLRSPRTAGASPLSQLQPAPCRCAVPLQQQQEQACNSPCGPPPPPPPPPCCAPGAAPSLKSLASSLDACEARECADEQEDAAAPEEEEQEQEIQELALRTNFSAIANFTASAPTDADGRALVSVRFPDSIAKYRVWAVAVADGGLYGLGESCVTARLPLVVRTTAPRFLSHGDASAVTVVVQNLTGKPREVRLAAAPSAHLRLASPAGLRGVVRPMSRRAFVFALRCVVPGAASLSVACASGAYGDAQRVAFPVYPPPLAAAPEARGVVDGGGGPRALLRVRVAMPEAALLAFGAVELSVAATVAGSLAGARAYLAAAAASGGTEQLLARALGLAALAQCSPGGSDRKALAKEVAQAVRAAGDRQAPSGEFRQWPGAPRLCAPFASLCACAHLAELRALGHKVPQKLLERCHRYAEAAADAADRGICAPGRAGRSDELAAAEACMAAHALLLLERADACAARAKGAARRHAEHFWATHAPEATPYEAAAWLLPALAGSAAAADVVEFLRDGARAAGDADGQRRSLFVSYYDDESAALAMHTGPRADAAVLLALARCGAATAATAQGDAGARDLAAALARGLASRTRWASTHEAAWAALALHGYLEACEAAPSSSSSTAAAPSLSAWVVPPGPAEAIYCGTTPPVVRGETCTVRVPLRAVFGGAAPQQAEGSGASSSSPSPSPSPSFEVLAAKSGAGRLYYSLRVLCSPSTFASPAVCNGFRVTREYVATGDDTGAVARSGDGDGDGAVWTVRLGAVVEAVVRVSTEQRRYNVAVVDRLAAGLEAAGAPGGGADAEAAQRPAWAEHVNVRDERAEAFASALGSGEHEFRYRLRATTAGTYHVAPARAEDMYDSDVFGATESCVVRVVAAQDT
eukprot:m51a1_g10778 hypothetical protein (4002) ;mRNA; r:32053-47400